MLKTLLKKQFLELNTFYFVNKKTGARKSAAGIAGTVILFVFLFLFVAVMFGGIAFLLADSLLGEMGHIPSPENDWLYFALMNVIALLFGTFGSVFNTYAGLYKAKDNEFLMSLPIPPKYILITRMFSVLAMSLLYAGMAYVPAMIVYWIFSSLTLPVVVYSILMFFCMALLVTVLTCIFGFLVAVCSAKMKNKNIMVVIISLVFFCGYYYVCFRMNEMLELLLYNAEKVGHVVKTWLFPLYAISRASCGDGLYMLIAVAIVLVLFVLCCMVMSGNLVKIAMANPAANKKAYKGEKFTSASEAAALRRREIKHFLSSPTYMLNTGFGLAILPILAIVAIFKLDADLMYVILEGFGLSAEIMGSVPVFIMGACCMIVSMNGFTAPSVSLEGKNISLIQSLPVRGRDVLHAKECVHVLLNVFPAFFFIIVLDILLGISAASLILSLAIVWIYIWFEAKLGLIIGLLKPNLTWTNEVVPIKQSFAVFVAIFGGWLISIGMIALYFVVCTYLSAELYMALLTVVLGGITLLMRQWLNTRGEARFAAL